MKNNHLFTNILKQIGLIILVTMVNLGVYVILGVFAEAASMTEDPRWLIQWLASSAGRFIVSLIWLMGIGFLAHYLYVRIGKYDKANHMESQMGLKDYGQAVFYFLLITLVDIGFHWFRLWNVGELESFSLTSIGLTHATENFIEASWIPLTLMTISLGILTPIFEELVFRTYLTNKFFINSKGWLPALISSAVYGFMYDIEWITFIHYFIVGFILFRAYSRRGNVKDSILVHIMSNLLTCFLLILNLLT